MQLPKTMLNTKVIVIFKIDIKGMKDIKEKDEKSG